MNKYLAECFGTFWLVLGLLFFGVFTQSMAPVFAGSLNPGNGGG